MTKVSAKLQPIPGSVFVGVRNPKEVVPAIPIERQYSDWANIASDIAADVPEIPESQSSLPPIDDLFAESLPLFIKASRWGRYVMPGPASRVQNNTTFIYQNPSPNFWNLYELAKGIFRDLGIRVSKQGGVWVAHIPIKCLTDKVFVESGLAGVEKILLEHTGIDPSAVLAGIRERQFQRTRDGIRNVKLGRSEGVREAVADAVGAVVIFAAAYVGFVVGGM